MKFKRLVLETTGKTWDDVLGSASEQVKNLAGEIHWERLGDEFLNANYLSWFLKKLDSNADLTDLESRLKVHLANMKYAFQMRMKNLALAVGVGLLPPVQYQCLYDLEVAVYGRATARYLRQLVC